MMTKEEARAWRERWRLVNEFEREELRTTPTEVKVRQFLSVMRLGRAMGWLDQPTDDDREVDDRWARLQAHARR